MTENYILDVNKEGSFEEYLDKIFHASTNLGRPLAIWKKGKYFTINAIVQLTDSQYTIDEIESAESGFIFAPFEKEKSIEYIKADILLNSEIKQIQVSPTFKDSPILDQFKSMLHATDSDENEKNEYSFKLENKNFLQKDKAAYYQLIEKSVEMIKSGRYQKIVPSRIKTIPVNKKFNPLQEFNKLCKAYPDAFVSLVYIPREGGLWLGATPELLMAIDKNKIFKTVALAGTQTVPNDFQLSKAAWMQKDIEEQALVSRYIINCFKQIRLREFSEYGPKTARAGNLIHLKTEFEVDMQAVNFSQLGTVMLDLLHPTSAVCGMPMLPSVRFLKENEGYDREYYSGYLGPVNIDNQIDIYVNLRCMKIMKDIAVLFAGGGVTEDSEPESEWLETEMKFQTLLDVIKPIE